MGFDTEGLSEELNATFMECMHGHGYKFYVGEIWLNTGGTKEVDIENMKNAYLAQLCKNSRFFLAVCHLNAFYRCLWTNKSVFERKLWYS